MIDYDQAWELQKQRIQKVLDQDLDGILIFCSHPPTVTLGRKGSKELDVLGWQGPLFEVERGGKATYHGPQQLVVYPIFNLQKFAPPRDIKAFLDFFIVSLVEALKELTNLPFEGKSYEKSPSGEDLTGIWLGEKKLASIGIGVKAWVTFHGAAINLAPDPQGFTAIRPCGFTADVMTSLQELTPSPPSREALITTFQKHLQEF